MRKNAEVARIFYEIADLLELQDIAWKPQAYRKAAQSIENLPKDISHVLKEGRVHDIPGVGEALAEKIREIVTTGKLLYLEKLRKAIPLDVEQFRKIEGLGPKTLKVLYKELHVKTLSDLKRAAEIGKIQQIKGLGEKKEQQILQAILRLQKRGPERFLFGDLVPFAKDLLHFFKQIHGTQHVELAGSYRRGKESIGDLDILLLSSNPKGAMKTFVSQKDVIQILAHGATKSSILFQNGLHVDVRIVKKEAYGAALMYFTGSKDHNVGLRKLALKKGYSLNEYGLSSLTTKKIVAGKTEEQVYRKLGLSYIPPELRENRGEIQRAAHHKIPTLISLKDIHGDFQTQSQWSDGMQSIEALAYAAQERGWKFITITDHVGGIGIANPLDEKRLKKQSAMIDTLNKKMDIHIFKGAEIDIKKDGTLALSRKACHNLDVVLASLHSSFRQSSAEMTQRICSAFENYPVHIFGHPTARLLYQRDPVEFDLQKVFSCAKEQGIFLEINGQPSRMDLKDTHAIHAREIGCSFALSSDAHSTEQLSYIDFALMISRRAWLEKAHILNCKRLQEIEKLLEKRKFK